MALALGDVYIAARSTVAKQRRNVYDCEDNQPPHVEISSQRLKLTLIQTEVSKSKAKHR